MKDKRVVITRAREQAAPFAALLEAEGAVPVLFPTIAFRPVEPVRGWVDRFLKSDIIIFTSSNGVKFFMELLRKQKVPFGEELFVVAIGPGTRDSLESYGIRVDLVPERFIAEGVLEALGNVEGRRVFIPRAKVAREVLPHELSRRGADVFVLPVYETVMPEPDEASVAELFSSHVLTFTSPSTVENFVKMLPDKWQRLCDEKVVASIGPVTTERANQLGVKVDITSEEHSIKGLVKALIDYFLSV